MSDQTPELNIPLFRKTMEWVNAEAAQPEELSEWNQAGWRTFSYDSNNTRCGTAYCVAGYVAHVTGAEWSKAMPDMVIREDGMREYPARYARDQLGITDSERSMLFSGANDIHDINMAAEIICENRGLNYKEMLG